MESTADADVPEVAASHVAPEWVVFACGEFEFGFPLERAKEILPPRESFTRVPGCGPEVVGLLGHRGRAVTVFDLGLVLGLSSSRAVRDYRVLLMEQEERVVGFIVDHVVAVARADVLHWNGAMTRPIDKAVTGRCTSEDASFYALDLDALINRLIA